MKNLIHLFRSELILKVLAVVGLVLSLGAWAFSSPVGASPDDDFHLTSIWCSGAGYSGMCEETGDADTRTVSDALTKAACYASDPEVSGACQTELSLFNNPDSSVTDRGSFQGNYPPVYYATMHVFAGADVEISALTMRWVNIVIFSVFFLVILLIAPRYLSRTIMGMWAVTSVPLGLFILASNNPSSWGLIGLGFGWIALHAFFVAEGKRKISFAVLYVLSVLIAAGSRGDAAVFVILSALLVVFLTFNKQRTYLLGLILPAAMGLVALFFFLSSQQSGVATTGLPFGEADQPSENRTALGVLFYNIVQLPFLLSGVFGTWNLGWLDTLMPAIVWVPSLAIFCGMVFATFARLTVRQGISLLGIGTVTMGIPLYVLQAAHAHVGEQVQPRYVLPLIVIFAGVALLTLGMGKISLSGVQLWIVFSALAIAQSVALYMNTRRYVWGIDSSAGWNLNSDVQWWWPAGPSPMLNWGVGSAGFILFLLAAGLFFKATDSKLKQSQVLG